MILLYHIFEGILSKSIRVKNPPDQNPLAFKIHPINIIFLLFINLFCKFFEVYLFIFHLIFTITISPNPYLRLVSGSQIWLGGFWRGWILNVSQSAYPRKAHKQIIFIYFIFLGCGTRRAKQKIENSEEERFDEIRWFGRKEGRFARRTCCWSKWLNIY